jgi:hypothetical protein
MKNELLQAASAPSGACGKAHPSGRNLASRRRQSAGLLTTCLAVVGAGQLAVAIAPIDQVVPDSYRFNAGPPVTDYSLYSVVDFGTTANPAGDYGTGEIVAKTTDGANFYAYILTADHVACVGGYGNNFVGIGVNNGVNTGTWLQDSLVAAGGPAAVPGVNFEDLAIVRVNLTGNQALWNALTPLQLANPSQRPTQVGNLFTEYGYGLTGTPGTFNPTNRTPLVGGTPGYASAASDFQLRFQDNTVAALLNNQNGGAAKPTSNNAGNNYIEPLLAWDVVAPANANFQGTSFGGDSGGPYLTSFPSSITINRGGTNYNGILLTDYIDAVHVLGNDPSLNGDVNDGVFINQANYDWIISEVPEPSSLAVMAAGSCVACLWYRRSSRGYRTTQRQCLAPGDRPVSRGPTQADHN